MITNKIRDWLLTCPLLPPGSLVVVDKIGADPGQYEIAALPCEPVLRPYTDGGSMRQFMFAVASREVYDERQNMDNTTFYDALQRWIETQSRSRNLPVLNAGRRPQAVNVVTSGYVHSAEDSTAIYQMECRQLYTQASNYSSKRSD